MKNAEERLIEIMKEQAELFLLDANEFYPFGTYINTDNEVVPFGGPMENDHPLSAEVIELLENYIKEILNRGKCKIAAIGVDVTERINGEAFDALEIRFFTNGRQPYKKYYRYIVGTDAVVFAEK